MLIFTISFSSCLSPRSAYFYEFPPTDGRETSKKRTTLARLLRGLKTVNRRDRQANQNSGTATQLRVSKRVSILEHQIYANFSEYLSTHTHVDLSLSLLTSIIRLKTLNKTFFVSHELLFRQLYKK